MEVDNLLADAEKLTGGKVTVEVVEGAGVNDSRCIKIQQFAENGRCGVGIKQKLTGLEPDQMYRMYAKVK